MHKSITASMEVGYAAWWTYSCGAGVRNVNIRNGQLDVQHCKKCKDYIYALRCDHIVLALVSMCSWSDWSLKEPTFIQLAIRPNPIDMYLCL